MLHVNNVIVADEPETPAVSPTSTSPPSTTSTSSSSSSSTNNPNPTGDTYYVGVAREDVTGPIVQVNMVRYISIFVLVFSLNKLKRKKSVTSECWKIARVSWYLQTRYSVKSILANCKLNSDGLRSSRTNCKRFAHSIVQSRFRHSRQ